MVDELKSNLTLEFESDVRELEFHFGLSNTKEPACCFLRFHQPCVCGVMLLAFRDKRRNQPRFRLAATLEACVYYFERINFAAQTTASLVIYAGD